VSHSLTQYRRRLMRSSPLSYAVSPATKDILASIRPSFRPSMVKFSSNSHQDRLVLKLALVSNTSITAGQCSVSDIPILWVYLTICTGHSCQMPASQCFLTQFQLAVVFTLFPNPQVPKSSSWNVTDQTVRDLKKFSAWGIL
jgi:hypothetical protein